MRGHPPRFKRTGWQEHLGQGSLNPPSKRETVRCSPRGSRGQPHTRIPQGECDTHILTAIKK
jgi:hypothetical protein